MRLSENLLPGDSADQKPAVGKNIPEIYRAVASRARDAADARNLLEHLGLLDPLTPKAQWKRANTPKAAP